MAQRENTAALKAESSLRTRRTGKRPILRFVLLFALLASAFNVFYYVKFAKMDAFLSYLHVNALVSAAVLRSFGMNAFAAGGDIVGDAFSIKIAMGCDAIQPIALFCCAVLASPAAFRPKALGLLAGATALLALNILRIVTLFLAGIHAPRLFAVLHLDVWQALFIFMALLLWIFWALWVNKPRDPKPHATP